jgi:predicted metal-dependent phosphoesterase TrpH
MTVDLHLHTTASDGWLTPSALVERAAAAGVHVMAITDHDTTAAIVEGRAAAGRLGIDVVAGIEVTAVEDGRDVHVLGYFIDPGDAEFNAFLTTQRTRRIARVQAIAARLATLGVPVDVAPLVAMAEAQSGKSIGRPQIARAMIDAGHARDIADAFDRYLAIGQPGFVPREGPSIGVVIDALHRAGGIASLAHPGKTQIDERIPALRQAGLDAIEAFHSDHDDAARARYAALAAELGCLVTGGSDFHGDPSHGREPGAVSVPPEAWARLCAARGHA